MEATRALTLIQIRMANCLITNYMKYELTLILCKSSRGVEERRSAAAVRGDFYLFFYRCGDLYNEVGPTSNSYGVIC